MLHELLYFRNDEHVVEINVCRELDLLVVIQNLYAFIEKCLMSAPQGHLIIHNFSFTFIEVECQI